MSETTETPKAETSNTVVPTALPSRSAALAAIEKGLKKSNNPEFRVGDTVKVHVKIREGGKERVQIFQGLVIGRHKGDEPTATFTVRKVSYNVGVERVFLVNSPMIEKIEVVSEGQVRRARLYYLRDLRGKSAKIKSQLVSHEENSAAESAPAEAAPVA